MNPEHQGQGTGLTLLVMMAIIAANMNICGLYGRVGITARSVVPTRYTHIYSIGMSSPVEIESISFSERTPFIRRHVR